MLLMNSGGNGAALSKVYSDDVFTSYTRTGTGVDSVVTTGIDMTKGYMLWSKGRSGATDHAIYDSARGVTFDLVSNSTAGQTTQVTGLKAASSTGYTVGSLAKMNTSTATYVDWVFRNADKFFSHTTVTKSAGSNATVSFPNLSTLGMVVVKRTDNTGSWYVWHRSLTAGKLLYLEQTAAEATLGHITVSGTTVTLVNSVIADGSYVVYAWAHDPSADGIIQCGGFTTDAGGNATVNLGWEPQFLITKQANKLGAWWIEDVARGMSLSSTNWLLANTSNAEGWNGTVDIRPNATGFTVVGGGAQFNTNASVVYIAIRRPNKPQTTGTQVYTSSTTSGVISTGFPVDLHIGATRAGASTNHSFHDRLRGGTKELVSSSTATESTVTDLLFDSNSGLRTSFASGLVNHFFRRAAGFFSSFAYTGTGSNTTQSHDLAAIPDLLVVKSRSAATDWQVWCNGLAANEKLVLNSNAGKVTDATAWNSTLPTSTNISLGTASATNANTATFIAYAFSNLPGIQKIGTYVGDGTSGRVIDCGFSTGARFVCIKAISTTGSWLVADSTRGIVSGNDPYLQLNSTAAEVTTEDWLDPASIGFIVNNVASSNANTNGVTYMFWAIS